MQKILHRDVKSKGKVVFGTLFQHEPVEAPFLWLVISPKSYGNYEAVTVWKLLHSPADISKAEKRGESCPLRLRAISKASLLSNNTRRTSPQRKHCFSGHTADGKKI